MELMQLALPQDPILPLWLKIAYSLFVAILVPVYWKNWGLANFLWFSDVALLVMLAAVWFESNLLAGMMGIAVLLPEIGWNVSYFTQLLTGKRIFSLTDYMFDKSRPIFLRALSLFHVVLPVLILWMISKLGFHENALWYQIFFGWFILLLTYLFTNPEENINRVFGPGENPQTKINQQLYFLLVMLAYPLIFYFPTYFLLRLLY